MRQLIAQCAYEARWAAFALACVVAALFAGFWLCWAVRGIRGKLRKVREPFDVWEDDDA